MKRQQEKPITAIIGNPPYSTGQSSANDMNENTHYEKLETSIREKYAKFTTVKNKNSLYDSYIKSFRWATDRIGESGIIGFVSNGQFIDSRAAEGLRKALYEEFNHLYIFNLRGDQRTIGEQSRKEGGKIFGSGSRTPVAISILVKDGSNINELHYHDIGDYLSQKEKLKIIEELSDISSVDWDTIQPDENNDWINQRDLMYSSYPILFGNNDDSIFIDKTTGITTARDNWIVGFSKTNVKKNTIKLIENYNAQVKEHGGKEVNQVKKDVIKDDNFVKWDDNLYILASKNHLIKTDDSCLTQYLYRPFTKKWIWYDKQIIQRPRKFDKLLQSRNTFIYTTGGGAKYFSLIASDMMFDKGLMSSGQAFYFKTYENNLLFSSFENIKQSFADRLQLSIYDSFAYIYALLHSTEYQQKYNNDLKKDLARIPIVKNKEKYVEVGQKLMDLHLNYEEVPVYDGVEITPLVNPSYKVTKMRFAKKRDEKGKSVNDLSTIIFNSDITISNIPEKAYEYVVNGRSAIEWIIDQYQVKTDKKSGITDDPNDYSNDEKYIFNLLLRIINVSIQTVDLINSLPKLEIDE